MPTPRIERGCLVLQTSANATTPAQLAYCLNTYVFFTEISWYNGPEGTRTPNLSLAKRLLPRLSYRPKTTVLKRVVSAALTTSTLAKWRSTAELYPHDQVALRGFEPRFAGSKPAVLPLDERAIIQPTS